MNHEDPNDLPQDDAAPVAHELPPEPRRPQARGRRRPKSPPAGTATAAREREKVGDRVTIYRTAESPYWQIGYSLHGRQVRRSLKTSDADDAREIAGRKNAELVLGLAEHPDARPVTVADACEQYLASIKAKGRDDKTLRTYACKLAPFEAFCQEKHVRHLNHVTANVLEDYQRALQSTGVVPGGPRKSRHGSGFRGANQPRTVRDKLKLVRQLIRWAIKRKLLRSDPAVGYDLPRAVKKKAHCWSPEELRAVLDHAPEGFLDLFDFLRYTGLRSDELCWLTKDDFCPDRRHVKVRAKTCPAAGQAWRPKHGRERIVPLCAEALTIASRAAAASPGPWLFYAPDTRSGQQGRWRKWRIWNAVKAAMKAAGVAKGTTHTFRHVYCSFLARHNVPRFTQMEIVGHDSLEVALQYSHVSADDLSDAIARVPFDTMLQSDSNEVR